MFQHLDEPTQVRKDADRVELVRAREVFADHGAFTGSLVEITRRAGQRNRAAVGLVGLGIALARMEIKIMFEEILARFNNFELLAAPLWMPNNRLHGVRELKLRMA